MSLSVLGYNSLHVPIIFRFHQSNVSAPVPPSIRSASHNIVLRHFPGYHVPSTRRIAHLRRNRHERLSEAGLCSYARGKGIPHIWLRQCRRTSLDRYRHLHTTAGTCGPDAPCCNAKSWSNLQFWGRHFVSNIIWMFKGRLPEQITAPARSPC